MPDWYMDNGDRTWVNTDEGIAYDTDNDAWCELGSSPGSTPYWWHFYDKGEGSFSCEASGAKLKETSERAKRRKAARERLEILEARIPELEDKANAGSIWSFGLIVGVPLLIALIASMHSISGGDFSNLAGVFYFWLFVLGALVLASASGLAYAVLCDSNAKTLKAEARELKKELGQRHRY